MKRYGLKKKIISIILAVLLLFTGVLPATASFADDGVEGFYEIQLFYKDTSTMVPSYIDDTAAEKEQYIEYMVEGDELNLTYKLIGCDMPDNGYIYWYSETPTLVDVTQEGVVKAFDSSKGAVIQSWIDNEVKTIPLIGSVLGSAVEKVFFNDYVDLDTMDTEEIVALLEDAFGSDSILSKWSDSYKGELVDSLRYYLDNINSNIHVQLYDADGTLLADDYVQICVTKCEEWYANFLPNGTHITNKSQIDTTVAVGSSVQLYAVTTPLRLHYNVVYSVKSTSVFTQGKVVATVNDSGLVTFKNTGTVTILVSPDTEEIIQGILEMVNYFYALENTGTLDTDQIAGILIDYVGLDMNRTVLAGILDVCFAVVDITQDTADPVQLTATAVEILSNLILQFVYNDSITFTVIEGQPLTDFSIDGATTVKEGSQIELAITDVVPSAGDTSDITWTSSDPSIASVDFETGIITGRDAGGSLGSISTQKCTITATSAANNVSKSVEITVTGKTGRYISDVEIIGASMLDSPGETNYNYTIYPSRVADADNLYINWGIVSEYDDDGNPVYLWADEENSASNGIGQIDCKGHYTALTGGVCEIALMAYTGYATSNGGFYEISSFTRTFEVTNGIPVESIEIAVTGCTSNGNVTTNNPVVIDGVTYQYITIDKSIMEAYNGNGAKLSASVYPENATNQDVTWVIDNEYYSMSDLSDDTHSVSVTQNAAHEVADVFNVYAVSNDGRIKSNVITVCIRKTAATSNVIDRDSIEIINGGTAEVTHTLTFASSPTDTGRCCYKANWYSSDESVFTVETQRNDNRDGIITAVDVGTATLYCVSADGGITDTCEVTVYPDKSYLENIVNLCNHTFVKRTNDNKELYKKYSKQLDLAYYVLYDEPMASQSTCDTYARELLYAFYNIGGFVSLSNIDILGSNKTALTSDYVSVTVDGNYTKYSYDFDYKVFPSNAMYSDVTWSSSSSSITVDQNGKCTPASNDACSALITCTVKDYMNNEISDSVYVSFVKTQATAVTLDITNIVDAPIGETRTITATVEPSSLIGKASCTDVHWESSDSSIATVDENGVVTFVAGGDCVIYCITNDGGKVAQCAVNVVTNYSALRLLIQQYTDLQLEEVNYYPDTWESFTSTLEAAQAMVAAGGYSQKEVDGMYADLENAYKGLKKYNYLQNVELYLDGEATSDFYQYDLSVLSEGLSYKNAVLDLNVRLYPNNASYATVEWESSTTDIAVSSDGKCTPTSNKYCYGMITCTVTDHFGNSFSDYVWVSYSYRPVTAVELSLTSVSGVIGDTYQLYASVKPDGILGANIQDYYWTSLDESVATVDENGLITFISAGATAVRAISYDGGIYGECIVSSGGDRTALKAAIDEYSDVDYKQYAYDYGMAFKSAYEKAQAILTDDTCTQEYIDSVTAELNNAYSQLADNPYINVTGINLTYVTAKRSLTNSSTDTGSGTVSSSTNAVSVNISSGSNYNNYNDLKITAACEPSDAMYKSLSWDITCSYKMDTSTSGSTITFTPTEKSEGAWAIATAVYTNHYDETFTRTFYVVMSDNTMTGFDITDSSKTIYATASPDTIAYTTQGSPEFGTVYWSSSNESVATVDENGIVTPVEKGEAVITGKTLDGGYTDKITYVVITDFSQLASKQTEYYNLIEAVTDTYTYREDTLEVLSKAVNDAKTMIDEQSATQAEVNAMIERLDEAYAGLIKYEYATGVTFDFSAQSNVSSVADGYIRYEGTSVYNKTISLNPSAYPENSVYTTMTFESSNSAITVDENGVIKNTSSNAGYTIITCTITNVRGDVYTSSYYVSFVRYGATGISFSDEMVYGAPSETVTLSPVFSNSANMQSSVSIVKDCIYTSSDESIAAVDNSGTVTFISQGEATITATAVDGGYTATIKAFTTWDTSALKAAIEDAEKIDYTDYAYEYGMAFKSAYENAVSVYENLNSLQDEIDEACTALTEAMTALDGNEFVSPEITIMRAGNAVDGSEPLLVDENGQVTISYTLNENAMVKSCEWTCECDDITDYEITSDNELVITKSEEGNSSVTVTLTATDDYDRQVAKTLTLLIIDGYIYASSISLTANAEAITDGTLTVSGCGTLYRNLDLTIGCVINPENANAVSSINYTSSSSYVEISDDGVISLTSAGKVQSSNTSTITCTVTNNDGTQITASVDILLIK